MALYLEFPLGNILPTAVDEEIFKGAYPRIYDKDIAPTDLGQIQTPFAENNTYRFFPISSYANGRGARFMLFRRNTERD